MPLGLQLPSGSGRDRLARPGGLHGLRGLDQRGLPEHEGVGRHAGRPHRSDEDGPGQRWDAGAFYSPLYGSNFSDNGLRAGTPYALFCLDPGIYQFCGALSAYGQSSDLLGASVAQVRQILGNGVVGNLPTGAGDLRYLFAAFTTAYARYVQSGAAAYAGTSASTPFAAGQVAGPVPDFALAYAMAHPGAPPFVLNTDDAFFDSYGGNANRSEFVQYDFADMTHDPTDLNLSMLLVGSNLQEIHYYRRLDREERALFLAMENSDGRAAKQAAWGLLRDGSSSVVLDEWGQARKNADMFITNIAGSPAIAGARFQPALDVSGNPVLVGTANAFDPCFPDTPPAMVAKTAWYCATHQDPDCPFEAPSDPVSGKILTRANGEPILAGYCGIWNPTALSLGTANIQLVNDDLPADTQVLEEVAEAVIPQRTNPYDPASTVLAPIKVLVPWKPFQNGVGFPVAATGQQDIFVQTAELDFTGQVVVPVLDYLPVQVAATGTDAGASGPSGTFAQILAYESQDFLGDVFLCYDTVTQDDRGGGMPGDILAAHMYTSVQDILSWVAGHPAAQDNCTIIVRYSSYDNYPDYVSSLANGVRLGIDQGAGYGRVTDLTLFTPGVGAPAQP